MKLNHDAEIMIIYDFADNSHLRKKPENPVNKGI